MGTKRARYREWGVAFLLRYCAQDMIPAAASGETENVVQVRKAELLPPEDKDLLPDTPDAPKVPEASFSPPLDLTKFAQSIAEIASTLGIDLPEGFLDASGLRSRNYRFGVKSERLALIAAFQMRVNGIIRLKCDEADEVRRHNLIRFKQLLDALFAWRMAVEEHYRVFLARERVDNERSIESARTRAEIAKYEEEIWQSQNRRQLPPAAEKDPVVEARTHAEIAKYEAEEAKYKREARDANREPTPPRSEKELNAERLQRLRDEIEQSKRDEEREIEAATRGAAEQDWPSEVKDEVVRIRTRYASLRDRKRGEMEELS